MTGEVFKKWGGQRDSNPQQQAPQAWTLPLSYGHQPETSTLLSPCFAVKPACDCPLSIRRHSLSSFTEKHFGLTFAAMVTLDACSLFSRLQPQELKALQQAAQEKRFSNGQDVFKEGDTGDGVHVVKEG